MLVKLERQVVSMPSTSYLLLFLSALPHCHNTGPLLPLLCDDSVTGLELRPKIDAIIAKYRREDGLH